MSDVTTYLVTNQITPTPPMPPRPGALHRPQPFVFQISSSIVTPACPSAPHLAHTPPPALVIYRTPFTVTVVASRSRINCHINGNENKADALVFTSSEVILVFELLRTNFHVCYFV